MPNSQRNKLKSGITNDTKVTLNLLSNVIGNSKNEISSLLKLSLTNTQVSRLCKTFANKLSANIKLWKTQLSKMVRLGGFFDRFLELLLKTGLLLIKNSVKH